MTQAEYAQLIELAYEDYRTLKQQNAPLQKQEEAFQFYQDLMLEAYHALRQEEGW
jgi:hypothetical protein